MVLPAFLAKGAPDLNGGAVINESCDSALVTLPPKSSRQHRIFAARAWHDRFGKADKGKEADMKPKPEFINLKIRQSPLHIENQHGSSLWFENGPCGP
jgi:hypothetical protein